MALFQKRHYEALARVLGRAEAHAAENATATAHVARLLADDNPKFDSARFYRAVSEEVNRISEEWLNHE